jgi:hypothetical protein
MYCRAMQGRLVTLAPVVSCDEVVGKLPDEELNHLEGSVEVADVANPSGSEGVSTCSRECCVVEHR